MIPARTNANTTHNTQRTQNIIYIDIYAQEKRNN